MHPMLREILLSAGVPGEDLGLRPVPDDRAHRYMIEDRAHHYMDATDHDRNEALTDCEADLAQARLDAATAAVEIAELEQVAKWIAGMADHGYHGPERREE